MSESKPPIWHLLLMMAWFALLLLATGGVFLLGLAFGSEAYRDRAIPVLELLIIGGPFLVGIVTCGVTVLLWNTGRYKPAYVVCAASIVMVIGFFAISSLIGIFAI